MMDQVKKIGWQFVELGVLLVSVCVLLSIIVGPESGYVNHVSENALRFLQSLPAGVMVGFAAVFAIHSWMKSAVR